MRALAVFLMLLAFLYSFKASAKDNVEMESTLDNFMILIGEHPDLIKVESIKAYANFLMGMSSIDPSMIVAWGERERKCLFITAICVGDLRFAEEIKPDYNLNESVALDKDYEIAFSHALVISNTDINSIPQDWILDNSYLNARDKNGLLSIHYMANKSNWKNSLPALFKQLKKTGLIHGTDEYLLFKSILESGMTGNQIIEMLSQLITNDFSLKRPTPELSFAFLAASMNYDVSIPVLELIEKKHPTLLTETGAEGENFAFYITDFSVAAWWLERPNLIGSLNKKGRGPITHWIKNNPGMVVDLVTVFGDKAINGADDSVTLGLKKYISDSRHQLTVQEKRTKGIELTYEDFDPLGPAFPTDKQLENYQHWLDEQMKHKPIVQSRLEKSIESFELKKIKIVEAIKVIEDYLNAK